MATRYVVGLPLRFSTWGHCSDAHAVRAAVGQVSLKFDVKRMPEDLPAKLAASLGSRAMYPILVWRSGAIMCPYSNWHSNSSAEPSPNNVDDVVLVRIDGDEVHVGHVQLLHVWRRAAVMRLGVRSPCRRTWYPIHRLLGWETGRMRCACA